MSSRINRLVRLRHLTLLWGAFLLLLSCHSKHLSTVDSRPNIVFILIDDLGWTDLPCYDNRFNEAPNLDRLSKAGMLFANAYAACPVCSPTRASIQAGQYPARVGITDFITGHWRPYEELTVPKNRTQYLPESIVTIGEALKETGYATGYFGKWHLGGKDEHLPGNQGYDDWRVHRAGVFYNLKSKSAIYPKDETLDDNDRLSEVLTDYSVDFIESHKNEPFFLFLSHYDVHVQLDADMDLIEKYLNKKKKDEYPGNAIYAAMIEHIDRSTGRIVDKLEDLGLDENTMVVFFSDNGGLVSRFDKIPLLAKDKLPVYKGSDLQYIASSNHPLRAEKGTIYEGGIREPLIIKWPKKIKAGSKSDALITSVDFYPTFVELAGGDLPNDQVMDGQSFVSLFDANVMDEDRAIFWHYPVYHHGVPAGAVRKGEWKLIEYYTDHRVELYNLTKDIGEAINLAEERPELTLELHQLLKAWREEVGAEMPVKNPDFDESKRYEWGRHPDRL